MISVKIHKSYRTVVAMCDSELLGKKFEEGIRQLDVRTNFYNGEEVSEEKALEIMQNYGIEDATFNIVGDNSVRLAIQAGIIGEESSAKIQNIPFALKLL